MYLNLKNCDIYAIPREYTGIFDRISKKEIEYVQYLMSQSKTDRFIHAFSSLGQKRFKTSVGVTVPDAINTETKTAYYFHGCHFHSHDPIICPINKKGCVEKAKKKNDEFNAKMLKLIEEHEDVNHVIVEWECSWDQRKRDEQDVVNFMKRKFVNQPLRRLVPRNARKKSS